MRDQIWDSSVVCVRCVFWLCFAVQPNLHVFAMQLIERTGTRINTKSFVEWRPSFGLCVCAEESNSAESATRLAVGGAGAGWRSSAGCRHRSSRGRVQGAFINCELSIRSN
jgi:hypothetical protein